MNLNGNLASIIEWLYPTARPGIDWEVVQDGPSQPCRISRWAVPGVPRPAEADVMAREQEFLALAPTWRERRARRAGVKDCAASRALAKVLIERDAEVRRAINDLPAGMVRPKLPVMTYEQLLALLESDA